MYIVQCFIPFHFDFFSSLIYLLCSVSVPHSFWQLKKFCKMYVKYLWCRTNILLCIKQFPFNLAQVQHCICRALKFKNENSIDKNWSSSTQKCWGENGRKRTKSDCNVLPSSYKCGCIHLLYRIALNIYFFVHMNSLFKDTLASIVSAECNEAYVDYLVCTFYNIETWKFLVWSRYK